MKTFGKFLAVFAPVLLFVGPVLVAVDMGMGFMGILGAVCVGGGASAFCTKYERLLKQA